MDRQLRLLVGGICVILLLAKSNAHAQDNDPSAPNVGTSDNQPESGSDARSIYADIPQFGGPISVGGQIAEDAATVPQWRLQGLQDHFEPWYRFKERLNDCQGLQFNIDESMFYQVATDSLGEHDAASGLVRVYGQWELLGRGSENPGLVVFKGENRHRIGTSITPFDLGFEAARSCRREPSSANLTLELRISIGSSTSSTDKCPSRSVPLTSRISSTSTR